MLEQFHHKAEIMEIGLGQIETNYFEFPDEDVRTGIEILKTKIIKRIPRD